MESFISNFYDRIPVVNEQPAVTNRRRKRQINQTETHDDDFFAISFDDFDSNFADSLEPSIDPDFEPAVDLPTGT